MKQLEITLYHAQLVYEVRNRAWMTGRARMDDASQPLISWVQASADAPDMAIIVRALQSALASLKGRISPYLAGIVAEKRMMERNYWKSLWHSYHRWHSYWYHHRGHDITMGPEDDRMLPEAEDTVTVVNLALPLNWNDAFSHDLAESMHDYVVSAALAEWFGVLAPGEADAYATRAADAWARVKHCVEMRIKRPRLAMDPL